MSWVGPDGGSFADAANWADLTVDDNPDTPEDERVGIRTPGASDDIAVHRRGTIALGTNVWRVRNVALSDPVRLEGGPLVIEDKLAIGPSLELSAANVEVGGDFLSHSGRVVVADGSYLYVQGHMRLHTSRLEVSPDSSIDVGDPLAPTPQGTMSIHGDADDDAEVWLFDGVITAPVVRLVRNAAGLPPTLQVQGGTIVGDVSNHGVIQPLRPSRIEGKFENHDDGVLDFSTPMITVLDTKQYGGAPLLDVQGVAALAGTLRYATNVFYYPWPSEEFQIPFVRYQKLEGRFDRFEGAAGRVNNVFLGLDYTIDRTIELFTLWKPLRPDRTYLDAPRGDYLAVVVSGISGTPVFNMAQAIEMGIAQGTWDVVTLDWSDYTEVDDKWVGSRRPEYVTDAYSIGESLAFWLEEAGLNQYQGYHILGNSGGVWLVDGLADRLKAMNRNLNIHTTYFDAYVPSPSFEIPGRSVKGPSQLGESAAWAEQYYDNRFGNFRFSSQSAYATLPHVYNLDVTKLDSLNRCGKFLRGPSICSPAHHWPQAWYLETVKNPNDPLAAGWGFRRSLEFAGMSPSHTTYPRGWKHVLPSGGLSYRPATWHGAPTFVEEIGVSPTGTVVVGPDGAYRLETGSPVELTISLDIDQPTNLLRFNYDFVTFDDLTDENGDAAPAPTGVLEVFFDGEPIFEIVEEVLEPPFDGPLGLGEWVLSEEPLSGPHELKFRLTADESGFSAARLWDIEWGWSEVVHDNPSPWTNPDNPHDVNANGAVELTDLLAVVTFLRNANSTQLPEPDGVAPPVYVDADQNGLATVNDLLEIVKALRAELDITRGEGEPPFAAPSQRERAFPKSDWVGTAWVGFSFEEDEWEDTLSCIARETMRAQRLPIPTRP